MDLYPASGRHLLATFVGCSFAALNDPEALREAVAAAAAASGATVLELAVHAFTPQGVTAVAILAESHASLHTYPEHGLAFWDCFTCGDTCDPSRSLAPLAAALGSQSVRSEVVERR